MLVKLYYMHLLKNRGGKGEREKKGVFKNYSVVFTHRTSICRWNYSEWLVIMTLEKCSS